MKPEEGILSTLTVSNILFVLGAFVLVWAVLHYLSRMFAALAQGRPRMRFVVRMIEPALRILFWFAALLFAVSLLLPRRTHSSRRLALPHSPWMGRVDQIKNLIGGFVIGPIAPTDRRPRPDRGA
jgi:hypothetical protein